MPTNYTDYDPAQPLSQEHFAALSEVKKIIEARIVYNRNLLEFMLNRENEIATNKLIKTLLPATNAHSLPLTKKKFISATANDCQYYKQYIQYIETCKTIATFDDLYFQIFIRSESEKYGETEIPKREEALLKGDAMSSAERKKLLEYSQVLNTEKDISELKYSQEICSILEKHISPRSCEFKQHHLFICSLSPENVPGVGIGWKTSLEDQSYSNIKALNKQLDKLPNKHISIDKNFNKIHELHIATKTNKLELYKQQLPPHPLDSFGSFNVYRVMRQFFDLCMDFLYTGDKLLHPKQKPKPPKKTKKIQTTTAPTSGLSIEAVVEQKECAAALTELTAPVIEPTAIQEKVSQCVLAFPMQEQKNVTPMPLIELSKIHPALQFIAGLHPTESETLLSWIRKAPHMQVEVGELTRTIKNLNGKIDMSGGGSHHRIIFKNSLAFVDTFEQDSTTGTESTAKGTLVKQHGKGKSSRFLPSYAIKTFMQTLQQMGVTETILRIYTRAHNSCVTFKNPQDKMVLLTKAQSALVRDQSKMLLLLGVHKSKKKQKGDYPALRKLNPIRSGAKDATQKLMGTVFSFL